MATKILPPADTLCFFCPSLLPRSRHPVKRYKYLLSDIFPRSQEEEPNDRKIGKLCEYASRNPLRIPKITNYLEHKCYKELRLEHYGSVKVVMAIYRRLLLSCKEQMPLFASSLLTIICTLLEQTRENEMCLNGCHSLFYFINFQEDGTYMFNLEGLVPKLCQLGQEMGEDEGSCNLRAAALQALSSMIWFMGEFSHVSAEFDNVVSVVLENYVSLYKQTDDPSNNEKEPHNKWVQQVLKAEGHVDSSAATMTRIPSWKNIVNVRGEMTLTMEEAKNPNFWSRICVHNMARLAREATTVRRVLESLFRYFDINDSWLPQSGLALCILLEMQVVMEKHEQNTHLLLSTLIKHLEHKTVLKQPELQLSIVEVTTCLAEQSKSLTSVPIIGAIADLERHLRKSMQNTASDAQKGNGLGKFNNTYQKAIDECLIQLTKKIGDAGPLLDLMAMMLENISMTPSIARSTLSMVYRTAQIIASLPNVLYQNKAFPEALFHQLLLAMVHPDREIHLEAHRIFSVVLVPSSVCPLANMSSAELEKINDLQRTLSRTVSVFSSSAALFGKLKKDMFSFKDNGFPDGVDSNNAKLFKLQSSQSWMYSRKNIASPNADMDRPSNSIQEVVPTSLKLSSRQIILMLSSLWVQALSPENTPQNYEAIAHTYSLILIFSYTKEASQATLDVLARSYQFAFSLRHISQTKGGTLPPSRRRSLFTLATSMIVFSSKAFNITPLIPIAKSSLIDKIADPFLRLVEDFKLQALNVSSDNSARVYGSKEDDISATETLSAIKLTEFQSKEAMVSLIINSLRLSDSEVSVIRKELLDEFSPDDMCPLGAQFIELSGRVTPKGSIDFKDLDVMSPLISFDDDCTEAQDDLADPKSQLSGDSNLLSVNQLLDSVLETSQAVGRLSVSNTPGVPFIEMASQCEALLMGKQQKLSLFMNTQQKQEMILSCYPQDQNEVKWSPPIFDEPVNSTSKLGNPFIEPNITPYQVTPYEVSPYQVSTNPAALCATEYYSQAQFYRLPASNPFDNFLKAAGC